MSKIHANAKVLLGQIRTQEERVIRDHAKTVADVMNQVNDNVFNAELELAKQKKRHKKMQRALAKYKKTGKVKHLSIFGV